VSLPKRGEGLQTAVRVSTSRRRHGCPIAKNLWQPVASPDEQRAGRDGRDGNSRHFKIAGVVSETLGEGLNVDFLSLVPRFENASMLCCQLLLSSLQVHTKLS
jgi:hypothetical protein